MKIAISITVHKNRVDSRIVPKQPKKDMNKITPPKTIKPMA